MREKILQKIQSHFQNSFVLYQRSDGFLDVHNKTPEEIRKLLALKGEPMPYQKVFDLYSESVQTYIPLSEWCQEWGIQPVFSTKSVCINGQVV